MKTEEIKEICFNCKHTKKYHNSIYKECACSQPTCQCTCFISSGIFYGMDLFTAFSVGVEEGYKKACEDILKLIDRYKDNNIIRWSKDKAEDYNEDLINISIEIRKLQEGKK
jgi:hypothetical protein